ncbi:hypothetical protein DIPPA_15473 [Diplonema papillatum]|nr:hypothetical protein DIPPA_15473 [Diplonema papillatum]
MFGSRASQSFARRAAMSLGRNPGLQNASVRGGMFLQNCSITTSPSRMATFQQLAANLQSADGILNSDVLDLAEVALSADGIVNSNVLDLAEVALVCDASRGVVGTSQ